jgi:hypothetical protein
MKNINTIIVAIVLVQVVLFTSCESRSLQELKPLVSAANVNYTNDIKPILDNKCINCHSGGNYFPDLDTYTNVYDYQKGIGSNAYNGPNAALGAPSLLCSVQASHCTSDRMPKGNAALSNDEITTISNWINNNYPQ